MIMKGRGFFCLETEKDKSRQIVSVDLSNGITANILAVVGPSKQTIQEAINCSFSYKAEYFNIL